MGGWTSMNAPKEKYKEFFFYLMTQIDNITSLSTKSVISFIWSVTTGKRWRYPVTGQFKGLAAAERKETYFV